MSAALDSLETQYLFLLQHLNDYEGACANDKQKASFGASFVTARQNYLDSLKKTFQDNDSKVADAVKDMKDAQDDLEDSLKHLNQIATVLNTISTAVKIGGKLAAMGA